MTTPVDWINIADHMPGGVVDFATALSLCPAGGVLYFPAGSYSTSSAAGWLINKPVTIMGDATSPNAAGTAGAVITPFDPGGTGTFRTFNSTVFKIASNDVVIRDLTIIALPYFDPASPPAIGTGDGIQVMAGSGVIYSNIRIEHVTITGMGHSSGGVRQVAELCQNRGRIQ